jgi:hypothetical protein
VRGADSRYNLIFAFGTHLARIQQIAEKLIAQNRLEEGTKTIVIRSQDVADFLKLTVSLSVTPMVAYIYGCDDGDSASACGNPSSPPLTSAVAGGLYRTARA